MPEADAHYRKNTAQSIRDIENCCDLFVSKSFDSSLAQTAEFTKNNEQFEIETPQTNFQTYDNTLQGSVGQSEERIKQACRKINQKILGQFRSLKTPTDSDKAIGMGLMTLFQEVQNLGSVLSWISVTLWLRKLDPILVHIRSMVRMVKQKKITLNIINKVKKRIAKVDHNKINPITQPILELVLATMQYYTALKTYNRSLSNSAASAIPRSKTQLRSNVTDCSIKRHFDSIAISPVKKLIRSKSKANEGDELKYIDPKIIETEINPDSTLLQLLIDQTRRDVHTLKAKHSKHEWEEVRQLKRQNSESEQKLMAKERNYEREEANRQSKLVRTIKQQDKLRETLERQRKISDAKEIEEQKLAEQKAKR